MANLIKIVVQNKSHLKMGNIVNMIKQEISLYHDNSNDYSYVFYGMKKV